MKFNRLALRAVLMLVVGSMAIVSCKKDDDDNNNGGGGTSQTKEQMLTGNAWVITSDVTTEEYDCDGDGTFDFEQVPTCYDACDLDDIWSFNADGTFTWSEGPINCNTSGPANEIYDQGTWTLNAAGTVLSMESNGFPYTINIQSLTASQLVIVDSYDSGSGTVTNTAAYQ